jgi:Tol biopolymer transport system component
MSFRRALRLAPVVALAATAIQASPAAATWPGSNGDIFAVSGNGAIARFSPSGQATGSVGSDLTEFSSFSLDAEGRRLAYSKNGDIYIVDLETMDEDQITQSPGAERDPTFSFDGRYLIYVAEGGGDSEIYTWDLTDPSFGPINLPNNEVDDWAPAFANDGTGHGDLIAYVSLEGSTDGGESDIWTMTPGGTDKTNLTNNNVPDFGPNWHPSFDMIAYSSRDAADRDQIFTMSWDGTGKDQLTSDANYNYEPAWSPDGTKIAFTKQGTAVGAIPRIYVRSGAPGGTETPLTPAGETGYDRAEWQSAPGGGEPIKPTLTFSLRRHVVVSGSAIGQGGEGAAGGTCGVGTPINIQRKIDGKFKTIASVATDVNGNFSKKVPDRTGSYRVVSTAYEDASTGTECLASQAAAKTHRHR